MNGQFYLLTLATAASAVLLTGCQSPNGTADKAAAGASVGAATGVSGNVADFRGHAPSPDFNTSTLQTSTVHDAAPAPVPPAVATPNLGDSSATGKWDVNDGWIWVPRSGTIPPSIGANWTQSRWYHGDDLWRFVESDFAPRIQGNWYRGNDGWLAELPARVAGWPEGNWLLETNGWHYVAGYWGD